MRDTILTEKILRNEKVNLYVIIMAYMEHIRGQEGHNLGYPSVIKRIMIIHWVYSPLGRELSFSSPRRWGSSLYHAKDGSRSARIIKPSDFGGSLYGDVFTTQRRVHTSLEAPRHYG